MATVKPGKVGEPKPVKAGEQGKQKKHNLGRKSAIWGGKRNLGRKSTLL